MSQQQQQSKAITDRYMYRVVPGDLLWARDAAAVSGMLVARWYADDALGCKRWFMLYLIEGDIVLIDNIHLNFTIKVVA